VARHIIDTLPRILPANQSWKLRLLQNWSSIIGTLQSKVVLHKVADDHVVLTVVHPSLAQELLFLSEVLLQKINSVVGENKIKTIHFRTQASSKKKTPQQQQKQVVSLKRNTEAFIRFTTREKEALTKVDNKELRKALSAFYTACKQRQTYK